MNVINYRYKIHLKQLGLHGNESDIVSFGQKDNDVSYISYEIQNLTQRKLRFFSHLLYIIIENSACVYYVCCTYDQI